MNNESRYTTVPMAPFTANVLCQAIAMLLDPKMPGYDSCFEFVKLCKQEGELQGWKTEEWAEFYDNHAFMFPKDLLQTTFNTVTMGGLSNFKAWRPIFPFTAVLALAVAKASSAQDTWTIQHTIEAAQDLIDTELAKGTGFMSEIERGMSEKELSTLIFMADWRVDTYLAAKGTFNPNEDEGDNYTEGEYGEIEPF